MNRGNGSEIEIISQTEFGIGKSYDDEGIETLE
jgi:hypothetical protein